MRCAASRPNAKLREALVNEIGQQPSGEEWDGQTEPTQLVVRGPNPVNVRLSINGKDQDVVIEPRVSLLDLLRERLELTGTKKGCDQGTCGACTAWVDGRRILSCLTLAIACEGASITTIEGLAEGDALHPMQRAFIAHDAFQCGYCTPGQIMSAVALLEEGHASDDSEIGEWMSGNICRCAAYPNIRAAIREVRDAAPDGHATD
jgi:xanthine dehydrogenase YagT iron-sulfur-binding subunit